MVLATKVARVRGAMMIEYGDAYSCRYPLYSVQGDFFMEKNLFEFVDDSIAYARNERARIEEKLKKTKI